MECPFLKVVRHQELTQTLCKYMPHSMHSTCKLLNFLRLRVTCRSVVNAVTLWLPERIHFLRQHHALRKVRDANGIIMASGFVWQLLFCGGSRIPSYRSFHPQGIRVIDFSGLAIDPDRGIPMGMTQRYWDERKRKKLLTGWVRDSDIDNVWRLQL